MTHITVCIPTYQRPQMLSRCIASLRDQRTDWFTYSIVVVDNDSAGSARGDAEGWRGRCGFELSYVLEERQNISLARNRGIRESSGDFLAFIDDDEIAGPDWLHNLFTAIMEYRADGVLGPVKPDYAGDPPRWLVRSELCVRESFPTGTILTRAKYMRTGNVLLRRGIFDGNDSPFNPRFGRSGGEDKDFFARMVADGHSFVWCEEACVHETVPLERQTRSYHLRRALLRGVTAAEQEPIISLRTVKSLIAVFVYGISLPFLLIAANSLSMKYLVRSFDHIAKLLAHIGIKLSTERRF